MYTAQDLSRKTNMSLRAVQRRLQKVTPVGYIPTSGSSYKVYDRSVEDLFPQLKFAYPEVIKNESATKVIECKMKDNPCKNKSRVISEQLTNNMIDRTKDDFLDQGDPNGLVRVCNKVVAEYWWKIEAELIESGKITNAKGELRTLESFQHYWYFKVINRSDKINQGVAIRNNWKQLWNSCHKVNETNGKMRTLRYSLLEMLEKKGLIGKGKGAGLIWVMDGTKFDAWTKGENGKPKSFNYLAIFDGVTKMPLYLRMLENGEKIVDVAEALWECVQLHGVPPLGIVADRGLAFKSREIQALVTSWYTPEQLKNFEICPFRNYFFGDGKGKPQRGAILYPLGKIPRSPIKACAERAFHSLNHHQQTNLAVSYCGTRDSLHLTHEIGSYPVEAVKHMLTSTESFKDFLHYVYTEYVNMVQPGSELLGYIEKQYKLRATPLEAWKFYGGDWALSETEIKVRGTEMLEMADTGYAYYQYATATKRHTVTSGQGGASVAHNKETFNFLGDVFSIDLQGKPICVVIDSAIGSKRGFVFIEHPCKDSDDKVIVNKASTLEYRGEAINAMIRDFDDVKPMKTLARKVRSNYNAALDKAKGGKKPYKNLAESNLHSLEYAGYEVLDSAFAERKRLDEESVIPLNPPLKLTIIHIF